MLNSRPSSPRRTGRVVALLAVAALAAAACVPRGAGQASPTPTLGPTPTPSANPYTGVTEGSGKGVKLGYLSFGEMVPYVFQISEGIRAQAALAGAELVECDAKLDAKNVPDCMKKLSDAGIQGLIQFQGTLTDPAVTCTETPSGVPVLAVEFPQPPCEKTLVGADDLRAGQIAGTAVGQWVKDKWSCTYDAYVSFESTAAADQEPPADGGLSPGLLRHLPHRERADRQGDRHRGDREDGHDGSPRGASRQVADRGRRGQRRRRPGRARRRQDRQPRRRRVGLGRRVPSCGCAT